MQINQVICYFTKMVPRILFPKVEECLNISPVTAITGPRQCGKTTLAREFAKDKSVHFFDLENPSDLFALEDPLFALQAYDEDLVIIDEAQRMPDIFPVLRVLVDQNRKPGRFLLLGSSSPDLRRQSAESLAGRIITLELTPFLEPEVVHDARTRDRLWLWGGFPPSFLADDNETSFQWRIQYLRDVVERDLGLLGFRLPPERMWRFLQMLAHNHGQLWNKAQLARSLDIGASTAGRYLDAILQTLLVRRIQPYHANLGKRLIKSPKIYIRDTGLLHALLGLKTREQLLGHPVVGNSWEGYVIENISACLPTGWETGFWRTSSGNEIDLILISGGRAEVAIEIKAGLTPRPRRGFYQACDTLKPKEAWIVYPGDKIISLNRGKAEAIPLMEAIRRIKAA